MYKKIKFVDLVIAILAICIAIILVVVFLGRANTATVIVVKGKNVSASTPLSKQMNLLEEVKVSPNELNQFQGSVATSPSQLNGKSLIISLPKGSPIPLSDLTAKPTGGALAQEVPIKHTLFLISSSNLATLPPGISPGDLINISLLSNDTGQGSQYTIATILKDVPVFSTNSNGAYLEVSHYDFLKLVEAQKLGTLIYSLPGKKSVTACQVGQSSASSSQNCYTPQDGESIVSSSDILSQLQGGSSSNGKTN